jgi:hypothetical protein
VKLAERQAAETDRLTLAVASAQGIAFGGEKAYEAWKRSRNTRVTSNEARAAAQNEALARIASWNVRGGNSLVREH